MYRYMVEFTCTHNGGHDVGRIPIEHPRPIPSVAFAQQNGLGKRIEQLSAQQGNAISNVVIVGISLA